MSKAFDLAQFVTAAPVNVGDGVVVTGLASPYPTKFATIPIASKPGVVVGSSMPAANAVDQILISGPGPTFDWGLGTNPAAAATVPKATAQYQMLMANDVLAWVTTTLDIVMSLGGAVTQAYGGVLVGNANIVFTPASAAAVRLDGGDPALSALDNFSWDAGTF